MSIFADNMKSKHHELNFETEVWAVRKHAPIKPARNFIEQFLSSSSDAEENLNKCGYIIPAWCDIKITVDKKGNKTVEYSDYDLEKEKFGPNETVTLKNVWKVWTKPNYSVMVLPVFFDDANFMAMPGVHDKDINTSDLPINIVLNNETNTLIEMGSPLIQIIPFRREKIKASSAALSNKTIERDKAIAGQHKLSFTKVKRWFNATKDYALSAYDTKFKMDSEKH